MSLDALSRLYAGRPSFDFLPNSPLGAGITKTAFFFLGFFDGLDDFEEDASFDALLSTGRWFAMRAASCAGGRGELKTRRK